MMSDNERNFMKSIFVLLNFYIETNANQVMVIETCVMILDCLKSVNLDASYLEDFLKERGHSLQEFGLESFQNIKTK